MQASDVSKEEVRARFDRLIARMAELNAHFSDEEVEADIEEARKECQARLEVPEFETYEEEAAFWDQLDTAPYMYDDGEWIRFETPHKRAIGDSSCSS